jgi:hypothetical protein
MKIEEEHTESEINLSSKYVYVDISDKEKLIECGKLVQSHKLRAYGFGNINKIIFQVI